MAEMTYEEWVEKFEPYCHENGELLSYDRLNEETVERYGGINHIWTQLADEFGDTIVTGAHWVNRDCYYITKKAWNEDNKWDTVPLEEEDYA